MSAPPHADSPPPAPDTRQPPATPAEPSCADTVPTIGVSHNAPDTAPGAAKSNGWMPMAGTRPRDAVDAILTQWQRERPDLDCTPMAPIGRLKRCAALLEARIEAGLAPFGLTLWEFDMLATLRRAGAPFRLSPTALFSTLMVTSGTMTHRLKQLEKRGLIGRLPNPDDARSLLVQLTPQGLALIDRAVEAHVENERQMLAALPASMVSALDEALSVWLGRLEQAAHDRTDGHHAGHARPALTFSGTSPVTDTSPAL